MGRRKKTETKEPKKEKTETLDQIIEKSEPVKTVPDLQKETVEKNIVDTPEKETLSDIIGVADNESVPVESKPRPDGYIDTPLEEQEWAEASEKNPEDIEKSKQTFYLRFMGGDSIKLWKTPPNDHLAGFQLLKKFLQLDMNNPDLQTRLLLYN